MACNKNFQTQCVYPLNPKYFKEDTVSEMLSIGDKMPDIGTIIEIVVDPVVTNMEIIKTIEGKSHEGQYLSGYKLLVDVNFREKILYAAKGVCQTVQGAHFEVAKTFFIIVPQEIDGIDLCTLLDNNRLKVKVYIEKVYGGVMDIRTIQKCMLVFLNVEII